MNHPVNTLSGTVSYHGEYTSDEHCHTFNHLELQTEGGLVVLENVMMANDSARAIIPGAKVALSYSMRAGTGAVVWAVLDRSRGRVHGDESLYAARAVAVKQALGLSVMAFIGYLVFVFPGLMLTWPTWKSWSTALSMPTEAEIRTSVQSLTPAMQTVDFSTFNIEAFA